ncbi:MAG: hypothetical protein ACK4MS_14950 [Paracoccaceae bacterium]
MERKARLLMAATLLLYFGPLLAGLSGMGWSATPVFIALIALWFVVMRPSQWPREMSVWTTDHVVAAAAQVAINAVIVVILFAIGRGIGGVAGFLPQISPFVPVALSFLSIPLSRLVWDPAKADEVDRLIEGAIDQLKVGTDGAMPLNPDGLEDPILQALLDLPSDVDAEMTAEAVDAAMLAPGASLRLSQMEDALDYADTPRLGLRKGLILWATDPLRRPDDNLKGIQQTAFHVARADADLLLLFAQRALPLVRARPALRSSFPDGETVRRAADASSLVTVKTSLVLLAETLDTLSAPQGQWRDDA